MSYAGWYKGKHARKAHTEMAHGRREHRMSRLAGPMLAFIAMMGVVVLLEVVFNL